MSASLETIRLLDAWHAGKPIDRGEVVNVHVADDEDVLIVAFIRMGGESRPWGVAIGTKADGPTVFTVPEGRNRQLVGDMMVKVAQIFLAHFRHPGWSEEGPAAYDIDPFRQVWLPGPTHVEMLHHLAAAYARTRWERDDVDTLRALGNLCNALFIESQRPGQQTVVSATTALRTCWTFPTAPIRQGHLGHLLAWLAGGRSRRTRLEAARAAEKVSVATVLNPDDERKVLAPLVEKWSEARRATDDKGMAREARRIEAALREHLVARWEAVARTVDQIATDPRPFNEGLSALVDQSATSMYYSWGRRTLNEEAGEEPYWPNVFTDNSARTAGAAYQRRVADDEKARHHLVHGDRELQREELAKGRGLICKVTNLGAAGKTWSASFSYPDLPTLKEGDEVVIAGAPDMKLDIVAIDLDTRTLVLSASWTRTKARYGDLGLPPSDPKWRGKSLVLLKSPAYGLSERKANVAGRLFGDDDIVTLLVNPRRRHAAHDEEGSVVELSTAEEARS